MPSGTVNQHFALMSLDRNELEVSKALLEMSEWSTDVHARSKKGPLSQQISNVIDGTLAQSLLVEMEQNR